MARPAKVLFKRPGSGLKPFAWSGSDAPYLDTPDTTLCGQVVIGRFGGAAEAGAKKNEDAALVWTADDNSWTVAALLDAHGSSDSAVLVLNQLTALGDTIEQIMADSTAPLWDLTALIVRHLNEAGFRQQCREVRGETALLVCAQKGAYLSWLSIGDIPVYVFHPDFARLNQFALNQRMFFEWTGKTNTFDLPLSCYATGVRQLRGGVHTILMATDGLLECGTRPFEAPHTLYEQFHSPVSAPSVCAAVESALKVVQTEQGKDSATLIAWRVDVPFCAEMMQPTA